MKSAEVCLTCPLAKLPVWIFALFWMCITKFALFNALANQQTVTDLQHAEAERRLRPAKIIEPPANVKVIAGETALFFCRATGNPTPTVNFLLDRTINQPLFRASVPIPDGSLLRLTKTHRSQNGLQVQCIARNHVGGDSASAHLVVYDVNMDPPEGYPVIQIPPQSTTAAVGDIARMECEVAGHPLPRVVWLKNEVPLSADGRRIITFGTGSIRFEHLLLSDEGQYECFAISNVGSVLSMKAYLSVKNTHSAPNIVDKAGQIHVRPGHGANLTCRATGNPVPMTRWLTDRESPITDFSEGAAVLFVADITEPTRYICEANNSLGTVQHPVRVHILDIPHPPVNLKCLEKGAYHAFLQWYPPAVPMKISGKRVPSAVVDSYMLLVSETNRSDIKDAKIQITDIPAKQHHPDGSLQYKLLNLKPYTSYTAEAVAVSNLLGLSDPSNSVKFTTAEAAPGSPPLSVSAVVLSDDTVQLRWKPPCQPNGKITKYHILYSFEHDHPLSDWHMVESNSDSTVISNLLSSKTYYFKVAAVNLVSTGPFTEPIPVIVKYGVPGSPIDFGGFSLSPTQIFLNWTAPQTHKDVRILDYVIRYRSDPVHTREENKFNTVPVSGLKTNIILDRLTPNTTYRVSIAARTSYGTGVAAQIVVQTESNVPSAPILHELEILDSSRIRVRWLSPKQPTQTVDLSGIIPHIPKHSASEVTHFLIQWAAFPFSDWEERKIIASSQQLSPHRVYEYVIGGLLSHTAYRVTISAVGSEGMGPPLDLGLLKTKGQVPSAPRNLRLNQLRRALPAGVKDPKAALAILELSWDPPERVHGELKAYQVSHRLIGPPEVLQSNAPGPYEGGSFRPIRRNVTHAAYTSTLADGIKFGRVYQFEVAAFNGVDLGMPAQLNVTTPEDAGPGTYQVQVHLNGISATSFEVVWTPPSQQHWDGTVIHYQVRYYQPNAPNETEVIRNTSEPRLIIKDLRERTFYTVMVRAITKNGPGPWSMPSMIQTTAELPEPPAQIMGVRINQRQIKVTWDTHLGVRKSKQRIPITGFRILYSKNVNEPDLSSWKILDVGPVTMATLDDLEPGAEYLIKIRSRGADRRYGHPSDPILVDARVSDGSGEFDEAGDKLAVSHLSCHWIPALDPAREDEASLKLSWRRPSQTEGLTHFQIQLLGTRSYIDEDAQPRRFAFEPRTLDVSLAMLDISNPTDVLYSSTRLTPILESSNSLYSLVIDELTANTVYDVQIRSMYQTSMLPHNVDQSAPVARTSCQTMMLPPSHVPVPIPVATKPRTGQVVVRVFRVSEILGRIRRYYLILSKTSSLVDFSVRPIAQESYWQNTFQQNWDPDSFVAAEYSQEVFSEPQMELLLSSPSYSRLKRCTGVKSTNNGSVTRHRPGRSSDLPASDPNILVYGRHLMPHQEYKAFVLACIYPNTDCSSKPRDDVFSTEQNFVQSDLPNKAGPVDGVEMIDSNARLCTSSDWSVGFSPHKLITYEDHTETGTQEPSEEPFGPVARPKIQLGGHADTFTVALTAVIVGLGIVAIICIAVGCIMRQRRSKTLRNNMTISLASVDNSLKTPLANPKIANFSENNGKIEQLQTKPLATASPSQSILGASHSNCNTPVKIRSAISITQLPEHVTMLKMNSGLEMSEEYESIEAGAGMTWIHANMEENRPKNRYANVVAYDHSRVILNEIKGVPGSDYINANYIDGYQRQKAYIATQGPLPETFYDFWRMVWEQNTHIIVMMTRLEERARVKCDQYWPTRGTETYSMAQGQQSMLDAACSYTVSTKDTQEFAYYTLRTFILKRNDLNSDTEVQAQQRQQLYRTPNPNERQRDVKEVKHFQFTAWPDYGTPDHAQPLLLFIRRVSQVRSQILHHLQQERIANGDSFNGAEHSRQHHSEMGPTIVHCSAGVGRTGAFVVIDSQLERLQHEKSIDIFGSVGRMRNQRNFMIQTEEQYTFLYDVFVEAVTVYGTEVTAHGLYNHVLKLRQTAPSNLMAHKRMMENGVQDGSMKELSMGFGQSGLDLEFKRLSENLVSSKQFSSALLPENRLKNRTADILPYEYNRVCLPVIRGLAGSDYVNANFIDGYRKKHAYIATQTPLLNTVDDFWRMMWEQGSPIIVVLGDSSTSGNIPPGSQQDAYWPTERSTRYQHLLVEPMVEYNMPHFILREFRLTDTRDGQSRTLRQFQLHGWPQDVVVPRSAEAIIDLIGQVHKTMAQFGQEGPITVHCNSGSGRTAVFIGLSLLLERMRCEGMVDVFLTTRMLRTQRMGMIQTTDQYAFCYAATLEYLASFDHYTSQ